MRPVAKLITANTIPRYKLLGSSGAKAYATKHNIAPAQSNKAKGEVSYFNNFNGHGVPFFSVNLLGPS